VSRRAVPALVMVLVGLVGLVIVGRDATEPPTPFFANTGGTWMPAVGESGSLTGSWFCPGIPTGDTSETADDGSDDGSADGEVGGEVVVSNSGSTEITGRYLILTDEGEVVDEPFSVPAFAQQRFDVGVRVADADFASVVVEIDGGGGFVEQVARHPLGDSVSACSTETSANWYLADGYTLDNSVETLVLTNPFDQPVVADLRFSTETSEAAPRQFDGFFVPPRSVETITIAELGARDEPIISVAVEATSGRLVVGRVQEYRGARVGYDVSLAAPELRDQWWFADGEIGDGITETFSVYNPTDEDIEVTVFFGGLALSASGVNERDPIVVPRFRAVIYDPTTDTASPLGQAGAEIDDEAADDEDAAGADVESDTEDGGDGDDDFVDLQQPSEVLPDGRHATVFSTLSQPSIVVERVLTRPSGESVSTTAVLGATVRPDSFVASSWSMGIGPDAPTEDALVVYNIDQVKALVTVSVVGPDGPTAVDSLSDIELGPGAVATIDLVDPAVIGQELIVSSSSRVFIERSLPRNAELTGRSGSWLLPNS